MASIASPSTLPSHTSFSAMSKDIQDLFLTINEALHRQFERFKETEFADHFNKSKAHILEAAKGLKGRALVLGVGAGNDIPLKELAEQFDEVVLVDIAPLPGPLFAKVPRELYHKIRLVSADLSGSFGSIARRVEELARRVTRDKFWEEAHKLLLAGEERLIWRDEKGPASFVVSSMLSSQLSNGAREIMEAVFQKVYKERPKSVYFTDYFHAYAAAVEASHAEDLYAFVAPEGKVYFSDNFTTPGEHIKEFLGGRLCGEADIPGIPLTGGRSTQEALRRLFTVKDGSKWVWKLPLYRRLEGGFTMEVAPSLAVSTFVLSRKAT